MRKKTKNLILWSVGLVFLVGVIALIAVSGNNSNSNPATYSASVLTAVENSFDFNTILMKDGEVYHRFELKNNGAEPVRIEKVYTSCMCTTASIIDASGRKRGTFGMPGHGLPSRTDVEIAPGESAYIDAVFDPAAHGPSGVGLAQRSIYLDTNSATSPKLELSFQAMVVR